MGDETTLFPPNINLATFAYSLKSAKILQLQFFTLMQNGFIIVLRSTALSGLFSMLDLTIYPFDSAIIK